MRFTFIKLLCAFTVALWGTVANGAEFNAIVSGIPLAWNEDMVVLPAAYIENSVININGSIYLENYGTILSDINVCGTSDVYVRNAGIIDGTINVADGASVVQVVTDSSDINTLSVSDRYDVLVLNSNGLSLNDVFGISNNVNSVILDNSELSLVRDAESFNGDIVLRGNVVLNLDDIGASDDALLTHVINEGILTINAVAPDSMFRVNGVIDNGNLYVRMTRETDYRIVFNNDVGVFLDNLRLVRPGDKLLTAMDNASDRNSLNRIMHSSVRFNPIKLMRPVQLMNRFLALDAFGRDLHDGVFANAMAMLSDDSTITSLMFGGTIAGGDRLAVSVFGYAGMFDFVDDIDDFSGNVFGANIGLHYDDSLIVGNANFGTGIAKFDVGPVWNGDKSVDNPNGRTMYFNANIGIHTLYDDSLDVIPYIALMGDSSRILNASDFDINGNLGVNISVRAGDDNIKYSYGMRGGVLTDGALYANGFVGLQLPYDDIMGEMSLGIMNDDMGVSYKASIIAKYVF